MTKTKKKVNVKRLVMAGVCLALAMLLPFLTGQIPEVGNLISPMHIPVLLCGFLCGWPYGLLVGFVAPLLRFVLFGMPPLMPTGLAMAFELATYGLVAALLYAALPKRFGFTYVALVGAMLAGRVVWGVASYVIYAVALGTPFTLQMFFAGAFLQALPGIVVHIVLIPPVVLALKKAKLAG